MPAPPIRTIIDTPQEGSWNMSVDQALLESAERLGQTTLRLYFWKPATVSLGYFQSYPDPQVHLPSQSCPKVRRATGGGAIVHDKELTYSLCLPSDAARPVDHRLMVSLVHRVFVEVLHQVGVRGCRIVESSRPQSASEPYLCFLRRACGDVELDGYKIIGSAQRRNKGAFLQHGSLLMSRSEFAPELPGVEELSGIDLRNCEFEKRWIEVLGRRLDKTIKMGQISPAEAASAKEIQCTRFGTQKWQRKR